MRFLYYADVEDAEAPDTAQDMPLAESANTP